MKQSRVLIVDDNEWNRNYLTDLIQSFGYQTEIAINGLEALESIKTNKPDIMLLDILMPVMNGFQVLEELKSQNRLFELPVIVVSALNDMDNIIKGIKLGAEDYIVKPIQPELLKVRIENSLQKQNYYEEEKLILKKLEEIKSCQVGLVVHDLNNPLSAIKGYTQVLGMKKDSNETTTFNYLKNIGKAVLEMQALIASLQDIARFEVNKTEMNAVVYDAIVLARDVFQSFQLERDETKICKFEAVESEVFIKGDRDLLSRVLKHLLSNADKHTMQGSKIDFTIEVQKNNLIFIIKDNGYGIAKKLQPMVFDKYFRVETKKINKKYGFGLGLYFCKMAVEAMLGKIWVESEEGQGAKFYISFEIENKI